MAKTVVVLGGSFAGLQIAHRLLKHTRNSVKDLKVILVSKNDHFYFNLASVRAIVPGVLQEDQFNKPIADGFKKYPKEAFELVVGSAERADLDGQTVTVVTATGEQTLKYDYLVLATGSRYRDHEIVPWKSYGTNEETMSQLRETAKKVQAAKHIVVAGAGPTGVETAGELGYAFKDREVILLSGDARLLGGDILSSNAEHELKKLGVKIKYNAKVTNTTTLDDGKMQVTLENGEQIATDLYLPTMGLIPNSEYLPETVLKANKCVAIDESYNVKGYKNVWAAGDIVSEPRASFVHADQQAAGVAKNIDAVLKGKKPSKVKMLPFDVLICACGRERGAGRMGSLKVFSYIAWTIKGKTLGMQRMPGIIDGSSF